MVGKEKRSKYLSVARTVIFLSDSGNGVLNCLNSSRCNYHIALCWLIISFHNPICSYNHLLTRIWVKHIFWRLLIARLLLHSIVFLRTYSVLTFAISGLLNIMGELSSILPAQFSTDQALQIHRCNLINISYNRSPISCFHHYIIKNFLNN